MNENHKQVGYYKYMIRVDQPAELLLTCLKKKSTLESPLNKKQ